MGKIEYLNVLGAQSEFSVMGSSWEDLKKKLHVLLVHIFTVSTLTFLLGFWELCV
jgi:hypothetical protein